MSERDEEDFDASLSGSGVIIGHPPTLTPTPSPAMLRLLRLESREVPAFFSGAEVVVGADAGSPPLVRLLDPTTQAERSQFLAFDAGFYGGVRVAVADVTGDRLPDLIAAAGPGGGPAIKVFDGQTGSATSFFAFAPSFTGGIYVAAADLTGDGVAEIVAGAGAGGGPAVNVFDGRTGLPLAAGFAFDESFLGGVRVAAADLDGDRRAEVVAAPGAGGGPNVRTLTLNSGAGRLDLSTSFFAYGPSFTGGVYVAAGDVDADGRAEIVTGPGAGGGPQVAVFDRVGRSEGAFFAYDPGFLGGVRVGTAHLSNANRADILTVAGPTGGAQVNIYTSANGATAGSLFGLPPSQMTGAFVAGSPVPLAINPTPGFIVSDAYAQLKRLQQAGKPVAPAPTQTTVINNQVVVVQPQVPFWTGAGYGLGFGGYGYGLGLRYYDALGLYSPLGGVYAPGFFGPGYFGSPTFVADPYFYSDLGSPVYGGYFDPYGYPLDSGYLDYYQPPVLVDPGYYDPGYYDPSYYDPGYYDPGYYDYGQYDYYDPWGGDYGYGDFGGWWW